MSFRQLQTLKLAILLLVLPRFLFSQAYAVKKYIYTYVYSVINIILASELKKYQFLMTAQQI